MKRKPSPLENGDRLTRAEFERRYNAMPEHVRAELVEGVVVMASPVRHTMHGAPHAYLIAWAVDFQTVCGWSVVLTSPVNLATMPR
jgi:hypothetical protein